MILQSLSSMWSAFAPAIGNHLWQSTLFTAVAGLLTLALRRNHARVRYWLWLAASLKFLVPFSLLTSLGSRMAWSREPAATQGALAFVIEQVSRPFAQQASSQSSVQTVFASLPAIFVAAWACGFAAVLMVWFARWRRVSAGIRNAAPLRQGREAAALRRLEQAAGIRRKIEIVLSGASLEPGILGIVKPVLIWPQESQTGWTMHIWTPFWRMKCGMCAAMTIWQQRSTWWWRPSSGSIPWCGGWERAWWMSASGPAMKKCCNWEASRRFTPKAF